MIRILLALIIIFFTQDCILSQRTLLEVENYYLQNLLGSASQNNIQEVIEKDSDQIVLRKWLFDVSGKLIEEIDYRGSTVASIINGIEEIFSNKKMSTHSYSYDSIGRKLKIIKKVYSAADTTHIENHFQYIGNDTIHETMNVSEKITYGDFGSENNIGLNICSLKVDNKVDSLSSYWFYNGTLTGIENVKYHYRNSGKLAKKEYSYDLEIDESDNTETKEKVSSKIYYEYDDYERLIRVRRYDQGKLIFENHLFYDSEDSTVQRIESKHDESREPQKITIELFYNEIGFLEKVISNNREYNYEIVTVKK
jgi:hypothetical protein